METDRRGIWTRTRSQQGSGGSFLKGELDGRGQQTGGSKMHPKLKEILLPAYQCVGFTGTCTSLMQWAPHLGHVPRGFYGATGDLEEVTLVLVLAEPGNPSPDPGPEECYSDVDSAFAFTGHCFLTAGGQGHENVRNLICRCFPGLSLVNAMRKVWITESVLCSAPSPGATVGVDIERFCAERFLLSQLRLFPLATIAAMGSKAMARLTRYQAQIPNRIVKCGAVFPPGCNFKSTRDSWDRLVEIVTEQGKGESARGEEYPVKLRSSPPRRRGLGSRAERRASAPRPGPIPHWENDLSLLKHLIEIIRSELPPDCQTTCITPTKKRVSLDIPYPFSRLTNSRKLVKMFVRPTQGVHVMVPPDLDLESRGWDLHEKQDSAGDQKLLFPFNKAETLARKLGKDLATFL